MEPLTPEEERAFRERAERFRQAQAEAAALAKASNPEVQAEDAEAQVAPLDEEGLERLQENFFPELGDNEALPSIRLVQGVIFDFDYTLAYLVRPLDELMAEGAKAAEAYMRSTGMELPPDFWSSIVEARRFAEEKSEEENEEHLADDAMSFLLQFFGYPASKMNPDVLKRAVDLFYAPEMTAWQLYPGVKTVLQELQAERFKLAVIANYNCDRVFQRTIDYLGIRPYLDICLCSAAVEFRKPDPRIFGIALQRWDAQPHEVVVVGDSLRHDIAGGLELGALTVQPTFATSPQVRYDNSQLGATVRPDAVIEELAALAPLVRKWAEP